MFKKKSLMFICLISILFTTSPVVNALEISFEGVVDWVDDVPPINLSERVPIGSAIWGSYEITGTETDIRDDDPDFGMYLVSYSVFFEDSGFPEGMSGFSSVGSLRILNDWGNPYYDLYNLNDSTTGPPPDGSGANPVQPLSFNLTFQDEDAIVFSDDSLPFGAPDIINDYESAYWNIQFFPGERLLGTITSIAEVAAPVPEPSTIVLMGLGLLGLAGFGRKKFSK